VLLVTDGTVTKSLEAYFGEPMEVVVLSHSEILSERNYPTIDVFPNDPILRRRVVLQGKHSRVAYAFAESTVAITSLPHDLRRRLTERKGGIGELIRESRLETYRDIWAIREATANSWAKHLDVDECDRVIVRDYTIYLSGKKAIEIEEVFPDSPFFT
jgi:chorismate-pyruvate lyase